MLQSLNKLGSFSFQVFICQAHTVICYNVSQYSAALCAVVRVVMVMLMVRGMRMVGVVIMVIMVKEVFPLVVHLTCLVP